MTNTVVKNATSKLLINERPIGIFFCTQNPQDIPASVLAQLGLKVQHALRAFTAADRKTIKQAAENYPETTYYKTEDAITQLGIGEAFITLLNEKGIPTPLVHTMLVPPRSRMDILSDSEIDGLVNKSKLVKKYAAVEDSQSAYEILTAKLEEAAQKSAAEEKEKDADKPSKRQEKSTVEKVLDNSVTRQIGRTAANVITRSLLGALGLGGRSVPGAPAPALRPGPGPHSLDGRRQRRQVEPSAGLGSGPLPLQTRPAAAKDGGYGVQ